MLKGAEAECKALKDEFKRRGLLEVAGDEFTVTSTEQIDGRLDAKAAREFLGEPIIASKRAALDRHPHQGVEPARRRGVAAAISVAARAHPAGRPLSDLQFTLIFSSIYERACALAACEAVPALPAPVMTREHANTIDEVIRLAADSLGVRCLAIQWMDATA